MRPLLIFLLFIGLEAKSQSPEELLAQWSRQSRIEKIYLHLDRENYIAGENIWFKAYLSSDHLPDTISTNLYAELLYTSDHVIERKVYPIIAGTSRGSIELPDSLPCGNYLIRAYTPAMHFGDADFVYLRQVYIYGKKKIVNDNAIKKTRLEFFPEGGNLVENMNNNLAFKASTANGLPVAVRGKIIDEKGNQLAELNTIHDGMGIFELKPGHGISYFAVLDNDTTRYAIPPANEKGMVISIVPHPQGHFFEINQNQSEPALRAAYIIGQMQHEPVFRINISPQQEEVRALINTTTLHSGIMQVTVFNKDGYPLAERLCFVNNKEYLLRAEIVFDTLNFSARAKNHFLLKMKDTVQGSFSISVTDPAFSIHSEREENIFSRFFLSSDLQGYIHNPAWYFRADDDSVRTALDLLMMTNGWRRFKWASLQKNSVARPRYTDHGFISVEGRALVRGTKKAFADRPVMIMIYDSSKNRITQVAKTDASGYFRLDSMVFFGKNRILFSDIKGRKSQYLDVILSSDSLNRIHYLPPVAKAWFNDPMPGPLKAFVNDYDAIQKANGLMMENVTIKVLKKSALQEVDDRYTKGAFSGQAEKIIDLVNSDEADPYANIFDYLQMRVNGLVVNRDGNDYSLMYRQQATISAMGAFPMTLFLDEVETDPTFIAAIPANQIALVKVFSNFAAATGNAPGGVLAIYTKNGHDYVSNKGPISYGTYQGYSISKEFYAPDYSVNKEESKADNRITLDWRPDIFCNYVNPSLPFSFYNNDRSKKFLVVVEGMTTNGKLLSVEKVVTGH
jgi:hypothetical protein